MRLVSFGRGKRALALGALTAWLLGGLGGRGLRPQLATGLLVITGLLVATAVGVIIANNR